jgi:hypothetical protein
MNQVLDSERVDFGKRLIALYLGADRDVDLLGWVAWSGEYAMRRELKGQSHETATRGVLSFVAPKLGLDDPYPAPVDPPIVVPPAGEFVPLSYGPRCLMRGSKRFRWVGVTSFALPWVWWTREPDARAWVDEHVSLGFNVFRFLTGWPAYGPPGFTYTMRIVVRPLLEYLKRVGAYAEVVCLSDTAEYRPRGWAGLGLGDATAHVAAVGEICRAVGNGLPQIANEAFHGAQAEYLHDPEQVNRLGNYLPPGAVWTASTAAVDEDTTPHGGYVTRHLDRGRDPMNMVRRVRELEALSRTLDRFVVNDEPIGAGEVDEPGRRSADPSVFFALGALNRLFEVGGTFHSEAGLLCGPMGPVQRECRRAFLAGNFAGIVDDSAVLAFENSNAPRPDGSRPWPNSPIQDHDQTRIVRAYSGVAGDRGLLVVLGVPDNRDALSCVEFGNGWGVAGPAQRWGSVEAYAIRKG